MTIHPLEQLLGHILDEHQAADAARMIVDANMYQAPEQPRPPTLGGRIIGTGHWVLDDIPLPAGVAHALAPGAPRIALRDPQGGSWASWPALDRLEGLRAQLNAGATLTRAATPKPAAANDLLGRMQAAPPGTHPLMPLLIGLDDQIRAQLPDLDQAIPRVRPSWWTNARIGDR